MSRSNASPYAANYAHSSSLPTKDVHTISPLYRACLSRMVREHGAAKSVKHRHSYLLHFIMRGLMGPARLETPRDSWDEYLGRRTLDAAAMMAFR